MKKLTAVMVLVGLTVACGDELGGIIAEIEEIYDRAEALLEQQVAEAPAAVAAAEEAVEAAEADLAAAQAAFDAVPQLPAPSVHEVLDREFMARSREESRVRGEEMRRLGRVVTAARFAVASAEGARRTVERRAAAAEETIERHRRQLQRLREAYEDDALDLLASRLGENVSPRSMMMGLKREAEAELARLEAGESQ